MKKSISPETIVVKFGLGMIGYKHMKRNFWIIAGILIMLSLLIGGYFVALRKGFLTKKEITYDNSISSIQNATGNPSTGQAGKQQVTDNTQGIEDDVKDVEIADNPSTISNVPFTIEKPYQSVEVVDSEKKNSPTDAGSGKIENKLVSWGFAKSTGRKIDTIVVHSSYNSLGSDKYDPDSIIDIYKQYGVSAHYLIGRDGTAYRLVEEKNIAWHAGVSRTPDGRTNVNDFSVGVEMINTMDGKYANVQYDTLNQIIKNLKSKYEIKYILGHSEIAPGRKTDPWRIDWDRIEN